MIQKNEQNAIVKLRAMHRDGHAEVAALPTREAVAEAIARFCYANRVSPRMVEVKVVWPCIPHDTSASLNTIRSIAREFKQGRG